MFNSNSATVTNPIGSRDFGFVRTILDEVEIDVFVHKNTLKKSGFAAADFALGVTVSLDYKQTKDGRFTSIRIFAIDGKVAVLPAPPITIDQFTKRVESAENKVTGERLWRILDAAEKFIEYLVADTNGVVTRRLGKVDVTEARVAIGLPPKAKSRMPRRVERLQQVFPMAAE